MKENRKRTGVRNEMLIDCGEVSSAQQVAALVSVSISANGVTSRLVKFSLLNDGKQGNVDVSCQHQIKQRRRITAHDKCPCKQQVATPNDRWITVCSERGRTICHPVRWYADQLKQRRPISLPSTVHFFAIKPNEPIRTGIGEIIICRI